MGGGYYDGTVQTATTPTGYSAVADRTLSVNRSCHADLNPKNKILICNQRQPVVIAIDVTGSMGNWSKIFFDKLPVFYGEIMLNGYLDDPAISFCGVGDANSDKAPLQTSPFAQGNEVGTQLAKLYLEGGGGGQNYETYELAAYFYARRIKVPNSDKAKSFFFFTGDEGYYPAVLKDFVKDHIGEDIDQSVPTRTIFQELKSKFNVFFIHKPYFDEDLDAKMVKKWEALLGPEHVVHLEEPKAVVDIVLGIMYLCGKHSTLDKYVDDMKHRDQTEDRIQLVRKALTRLWAYIQMQSGGSQYSFEDGSSSSGNVKNIYDIPTDEDSSSSGTSTTTTSTTTGSNDNTEKQELKKKLDKLKNEGVTIPISYLCPITQEPFVDPVFTDDGHTYEREAIEQWLTQSTKSPLTNQELTSKTLRPNFALKQMIQDFVMLHSK